MRMDKVREILEELRMVLAGRSSFLDSLLPPILFVLLNAHLGRAGRHLGLAGAGRCHRHLPPVQAPVSALRPWRCRRCGPGGSGRLSAGPRGRLLSAHHHHRRATVLLCLVSVLVGRPIVAFTSFVARRWPLDWYWHPQVRPAYSEVTWMWVVFFGLRLLLQFNLFQEEAASLLGIVQLLTGWPATIILLIVSYLYGTWRLRNLGGPSVEEFKSGAEPPWEGQQRGF